MKEIKKYKFKSIGKKNEFDKLVWSVIDGTGKVLSIPFHPAFEGMYPRGSMLPILVTIDRGYKTYNADWEEIYSEIYVVGKEYSFRVEKVQENEKTLVTELVLRDSHGFMFILRHPSVDEQKKVGKNVWAKVVSISDRGVELESSNQKKTDYVSLTSSEEDTLFDKLHDSRVASCAEFNKRSFRGVWRSVIDKYPDTAHFIYELLQNADDALATKASIILYKDSLIFKHNGTVHFSVTDDDDDTITPGHINSITGIGDSSKNDKENKIGKFGVGFKSVFQYTDIPEIYDTKFKFRIVNNIIPERLFDDHPAREPLETLFFIPFKNPKAAYDDISSKLKRMANGTLFLHNLTTIRWKDDVSGESRAYTKQIQSTYQSKRKILLEKLLVDDIEGKREILMFSRIIDLKEEGKHPIYVGYYLTESGEIDTEIRPHVYCFFPTAESFDVCMITHAPFKLVDNRQLIKPNEEANDILVKELGKLAADSLCELKEYGLREGHYILNENIAEITQWDQYDAYRWRDTSIIRLSAMQNPCIEKIKNDELLFSVDNRYRKPCNLYQVLPKSLSELVSAQQLKKLTGRDEDISILCPELNMIHEQEVFDEIGLHTFVTKDFAGKITPEFMASQSATWVNRLFTFLNKEVRNSWNPEEKDPFFLNAPIIQTTRKTWVAPFDGGRINVFSEGDPQEYNVVSNEMLSNAQVKKFLNDIGCKEPDQLDYINKRILDKFLTQADFEESELLSDLAQILKFYVSASIESRKELLAKARTNLLLANIDTTGNDSNPLDVPSHLYLDRQDLKLYFAGNKEVLFIDRKFYQPVIKEFGNETFNAFLTDLGVRLFPEVNTIAGSNKEYLSKRQDEQIGYHYSKHSPKIEDYDLAGLRYALNHVDNKEKSLAIWYSVVGAGVNDYLIATYKYFYYNWNTVFFDSTILDLLKSKAWISIDGKMLKPASVSLEQFAAEGYQVNESLCSQLEIKKREIDLAAVGASKDQIRQQKFGKYLEERGISMDDVDDEVVRMIEKKKKAAARKAEQAKQEAMSNEVLSSARKELAQSNADIFNTGGSLPKHVKDDKSEEQRASEIEEKLQKQKDKVMDDLARNEEMEKQRIAASHIPRYTKEWFMTLLDLEYRNAPAPDPKTNSKAISISFGKVVRDKVNDRILILKNPSQAIPLDIETIDRIEVRFEFRNQDDKPIVFEVASVRDFTLRLKAKATDAAFIKKTNWEGDCTRAVVNANNPTELMGKLINAFEGLEVEDGFDFKANLEDNISFVFGPPGTGKTTYVSKQICSIMKDELDCKILVLAPTNKACDVITERISSLADRPAWLGRFVATGSEIIEKDELLCPRESELYNEDQCCIVSTIARLPYDGFNWLSGGAPRLKDLDWNYVIIDEASMIPLAQIVYAIYRFSPYSKIIISGDPLQIPPIVREKQWENENIYTMINLNRFDNPVTEPLQFEVTNLTTQYRSVPAIGEIFSRYSYGGLLQHHRAQDDQKRITIKNLPMKTINFVSFKVEKYDSIFGPKKLSGSNVQIYSVLLVTELSKYLAKRYQGDRKIEVGIICPYVAESQMIERLVEQIQDIPENVHFTVGTIHGFQGDECDIVFVVFNPPKGLASHPNDIMLNKKHIINVAVSRARDYLFLLIPHQSTDGFGYLEEIKRLGRITNEASQAHVAYFTSDDIEEIIFGRKFYLENNTFVTSHQMANVYTEAGMKYEVRIDDNSVDVQITE